MGLGKKHLYLNSILFFPLVFEFLRKSEIFLCAFTGEMVNVRAEGGRDAGALLEWPTQVSNTKQ